MIVTRTPLRVSFLGGGTDLRSFYSREYGCVLSTAINKYMYVALHDKFDGKITLNYSQRETVDTVDEIKHPIIREAMRITGVTKPIEMMSAADIPTEGTGLAGSSAFTVGLLNALHRFQKHTPTPEQLAQEACNIEIETLGEPIGKQDQYIAAYGGLRFIKFNPDESVETTQVVIKPECKKTLEDSLLMFYTGITRKASSVLAEQKKNTETNAGAFASLQKMKAMAEQLRLDLSANNPATLGQLLARAWEEKKKLASNITNPAIDSIYSTAIEAGATGGKVLGAGGGGFLLLVASPQTREKVRYALSGYREMHIRFENQGSIAYEM